jgi:DNA-binding MarR family transcriptional regulator
MLAHNITPQAMAEIARYLEQRGYLERLPDPTDGRGRVLRLTDRGRAASAVARIVFTDLENRWETQLGTTRFFQLRSMLTELAGD